MPLEKPFVYVFKFSFYTCLYVDTFITKQNHKSTGCFQRPQQYMEVYSTNTKLKLFGAFVKSTSMYGSECWTVNKKSEKKWRVFQQKCLRRILRVFYPNLVSNEEILRTEQTDIMEELTDRVAVDWVHGPEITISPNKLLGGN
jgi:hypothetical protein